MISYPLRQKLPHFVSLTRINRPIGIYLLMWPMLWAFWMAAAALMLHGLHDSLHRIGWLLGRIRAGWVLRFSSASPLIMLGRYKLIA